MSANIYGLWVTIGFFGFILIFVFLGHWLYSLYKKRMNQKIIKQYTLNDFNYYEDVELNFSSNGNSK
jgi:hypothetical protein